MAPAGSGRWSCAVYGCVACAGIHQPGYTMWDIRVEQYSAIAQPISGLGLGTTGPYMNAAFVAYGVLVIIGATGIFRGITQMQSAGRWTCSALLALHGLGAVIDGIFTLESIVVHTIGFMLALTPIATFLVISHHLRRIPSWRRFGTWLLVASPVTLILAVVHFATFDPRAAGIGIGIAGLTQRLLLVEMQVWIAAMGWLAFRRGALEGPSQLAAAERR